MKMGSVLDFSTKSYRFNYCHCYTFAISFRFISNNSTFGCFIMGSFKSHTRYVCEILHLAIEIIIYSYLQQHYVYKSKLPNMTNCRLSSSSQCNNKQGLVGYRNVAWRPLMEETAASFSQHIPLNILKHIWTEPTRHSGSGMRTT